MASKSKATLSCILLLCVLPCSAYASSKNDKVSGAGMLIGAGSLAACIGSFGLACALEASLLIHGGVFLICDPYPPLDDPMRYDNNYFVVPSVPKVEMDPFIDYSGFSTGLGAQVRQMFDDFETITKLAREIGTGMDRYLSAIADGQPDAAALQLQALQQRDALMQPSVFDTAADLRLVANSLISENPFPIGQIDKATGLSLLNAWKNQNYGAGGLPLGELPIVNVFGLTSLEQYASYNIADAGPAGLAAVPASWDLIDAMRYWAALFDGDTTNVDAAFTGPGGLLEGLDGPVCATCIAASAVPEPGTLLLIISGMTVSAARKFRRRVS